TAASYKSRLKLHIRPALGRLRLDEIDKQSEQRLKAAMKQFDPGTINDTSRALPSAQLRRGMGRHRVGTAVREAEDSPDGNRVLGLRRLRAAGGWRSQSGPCRARVR